MLGSAVLLDSSLPPPAAHYQPVTSQPPPQTILGRYINLLSCLLYVIVLGTRDKLQHPSFQDSFGGS